MYYQHFLGVDVLELAARVSDAAAVTAKYEIPTMQAAECVVCHKTLDPVAGLFQDYWRSRTRASTASGRAAGSRTCSAPASRARTCRRRSGGGRCSGSASARRRTRASPSRWSSTSTTSSPAARCCCRRRTSTTRSTPRSGGPTASSAAQIEAIAARFAKTGFNLKSVFKDWVVSDFYRADGLATAVEGPEPAGGTGRRRAGADARRPSRSSGRWPRSSASGGAG